MQPRRTAFAIIAAGLAAAALAAFFLYGIGRRDVHGAGPPPALGKLTLTAGQPETPDPAFYDSAGRLVHVSDFRGRWVLLNLWATWCTPCVTELPTLAHAQGHLSSERIVIVAVDLEHHDAPEVVEFLKAHDAGALAVYIDRDLALMRSFKAFGLPLSVLIDPEGREVARAFGPEEWDNPAALDYLRALINAPMPARAN